MLKLQIKSLNMQIKKDKDLMVSIDNSKQELQDSISQLTDQNL
mgnify:CR=1 FL=1